MKKKIKDSNYEQVCNNNGFFRDRVPVAILYSKNNLLITRVPINTALRNMGCQIRTLDLYIPAACHDFSAFCIQKPPSGSNDVLNGSTNKTGGSISWPECVKIEYMYERKINTKKRRYFGCKILFGEWIITQTVNVNHILLLFNVFKVFQWKN